MKKLFISQPMRGLSDEQILKAREEIRERVSQRVDEDVEIIDSFISDYPSEINKQIPVCILVNQFSYYHKQI